MGDDSENVNKIRNLLEPPTRRATGGESGATASWRREPGGWNPRGRGRQNVRPHNDFISSGHRGGRGGFHNRHQQQAESFQGQSNSAFGAPRRPNNGPVSFAAFLNSVQHDEATTLVFKLAERSDDLGEYVQSRMDSKEFQLLLRVLRKTCECNFDQNKALLITRACQPEFLSRFPTMLVECALDKKESGATLAEVAMDMVRFFATVTMLLPLTAVGFKATAQSSLSSLLCLSAQEESKEAVPVTLVKQFQEVLKDLEALQVSAPKSNSRWLAKRKQLAEKQKFEQPPDDFREISIYPSSQEVLSARPPFLRPNVVDGPYFDVEHYLDVQFRLLREDFVRPLREGVRDIVNNTSSRKCESLSVQIYRDVQFLNYVRERDPRTNRVTSEGTLLSFDTTRTRFKRTNWQQSKKFLFGALLCFTSDNFNSLLFATVSGRDVSMLYRCQILVKFCEGYEENVFDPNKKYIMIESEVFFEPYYQVLSTLKRFNDFNFPMARYLIGLEKEDKYPKYLIYKKQYRSLLLGLSNLHIESDDDDDDDYYLHYNHLERQELKDEFHKLKILTGVNDKEGTDYWFTKRANPVEVDAAGKDGQNFAFRILEADTWPGAEELGLDSSQYKALQAALTKELVVIQGPPGTGKTFMALKIAEILIKNKRNMGRGTPILVVCLTNHALDQFLVGMMPFTEDIVRVGGQSKRPELDAMNLKNKHMPRSKDQHLMILKHRNNLDRLHQVLDGLEHRLYAVEKGLSKEGFVFLPGTDLKTQLLNGLLGDYLCMFLNHEEGFLAFADVRKYIHDWKVAETQNILNEDHSIAEASRYQQDIEQQGYYLEAELDFLETYVRSYKPTKPGAYSPRQEQRNFHVSVEQKLEMYFVTLTEQRDLLQTKKLRLVDETTKLSQALDEIRWMEQIRVLEDQDVIGLTTTGAARLQKMLSTIGCEIVIVEEAAEVMESHVVACLSQKCQQLILIGDHKQLRPSIAVYELGKFFNFDISLFERMVNNREGCVTLQVQHRMCPEMAHLIVPSIYKTLQNHESVLDRPLIKSLPKRLFFKTHSEIESMDREMSSRKNEFEANYLIALSKHLLNQGYDPSEITVLSTYTGQMFLIKRKIQELHDDQLKNVQVTVVDNFQGEENKIILLSLVRSNAEGRIGFLATENRVCVALSRARDGFFIVGNMEILAANNPTWIAVKNSFEKQEAIGPGIPVRCEVHPEQTFDFVNAEDARKFAPRGGCTLICEDILNCGHKCNNICHLVMYDHSNIKCQAPCERLCEAGLHPCKQLCFVECGNSCAEIVVKELPCSHSASISCSRKPEDVNCMQLIEKEFPLCQHKVTVACSSKSCSSPCLYQVPCGHSCVLTCHVDQDPDHLSYTCNKPCTRLKKICSGSHPCEKRCHEDCDLCEEKVEKKRSCGHTFKMNCHEDAEEITCRENCKRSLACGHFCKRKCHESCNPCTQLVDKVVPHCGHTAKVPCGRDALREDCENECELKVAGCQHPCRAKCAEACTVNCREVDGLQMGSCGHEVKRFCFEARQGLSADIQRCNAACDAVLKCGHNCTGTCKSCYQGRFHMPCKDKSLKELVCGHSAKYECSMLHPPLCNADRFLICEHGEMKVKCGFNVQHNCKKPCNYGCEHSKCTRQCGMTCNREPCVEECKKALPCGHPCIGFCGELCPDLCWVCDRSELTGTSVRVQDASIVTENSRFVLLPDCKHTVEENALASWFEWQTQNMEALSCPLCETAVSLKFRRFKKSVMKAFEGWNKIRNKIELSKVCPSEDLHYIVDSLKSCFKESGFVGLVSFIEELLKATASKEDAMQRQKKKRGVTGVMHLHLSKKIAVLVRLANMYVRFSRTSKSSELLKQIEFLVSVLKCTNTFSQQHYDDYEKLLALISNHQLVSAIRARLEDDKKYQFACYMKDKVNMSLPLHQLKTHWQMCMTCGKVIFGTKVDHTKCDQRKCNAFLEKPRFCSPK